MSAQRILARALKFCDLTSVSCKNFRCRRQTKMELKTFNHAVGQNSYHFVWCPRFRHKIFKHADLKFACKNILHAICRKYDFEIFELEIGIDHIHLFVDITPKISISKAFQLLKGISSRMIFKSFPDLLYFRCNPKLHQPTKRS